MTSHRPLVFVTGIAEGFGTSIAKTFAAAGHDVLGLARTLRVKNGVACAVRRSGGEYVHLACDLTVPGQVAEALSPYAARVSVFVHNAHRLLIKAVDATTPQEFEEVWRTTCWGAMTAANVLLPPMIERGAGSIILSGATASVRGGANFAAFASAKFALRGFAQSLARECGPKGIHVAHVMLDGLIEEPPTDARFGAANGGRLDPDAIAKVYVDLAAQHPSAWTHELDLRSASERF
jgi:NAD(P)-dependent dehydrogenase (short-subunit alcohol dehydrogenase family)